MLPPLINLLISSLSRRGLKTNVSKGGGRRISFGKMCHQETHIRLFPWRRKRCPYQALQEALIPWVSAFQMILITSYLHFLTLSSVKGLLPLHALHPAISRLIISHRYVSETLILLGPPFLMTWISLYSYTTYLGMMTPAVWISTSSQSAPAGGLWSVLSTSVMASTATVLRKFRDPISFKDGFICVCLAVLGLCCCMGSSLVAGDGAALWLWCSGFSCCEHRL